jgi:hypothetical protein
MADRPDGARPLDVITIGRSSIDLYGQQIGPTLEDVVSFAKSVGAHIGRRAYQHAAPDRARQGTSLPPRQRDHDSSSGPSHLEKPPAGSILLGGGHSMQAGYGVSMRGSWHRSGSAVA